MFCINAIERSKLLPTLIFLILCYALLINHRFGYISIVGVVSTLVYILEFQNKYLDAKTLLIFTYSVVYVFLSNMNGITYSSSTLVLYLLAPTAFYIIGRRMVRHSNKSSQLSRLWIIILIAYTADIFRAIVMKIFISGELVNTSRLFYLDASNSMLISATQVGLCVNLGFVGLPMFYIETNRLYKYIYISIFFLSILTTVHLVNRTGIVICLLSLVILLALHFRKRVLQFISLLITLGATIVILFNSEVLSSKILRSYVERNDVQDITGGRVDFWAAAIEQLICSPFGWVSERESFLIHNMWLDIAQFSGWIPCLIAIYFTCSTFFKAFSLVKSNQSTVSYLLFGLSINMFLAYFVEPVTGGTFFMMYCLLWGSINELYKTINNGY